jgi:hypothetical protein
VIDYALKGCFVCHLDDTHRAQKASKAGEIGGKELMVEIQPAKRYIKSTDSVPITNQLKDGEIYAY